MSFELIKNEKPNLKKCEMLCDEVLNKKLDKYELTKFLNCHQTSLLIGKPKSGKTSLLYSLFENKTLFRGVFHNIFLFQPSQSRASMKDKLFDDLPEEQKFDELTIDNLQTVINTIKNENRKFNNCILIDDMTAYLKNNDIMKAFKELVWNRRHLRTSIFFLCQSWFSVPKDIRRVFSNVFIFKTNIEEFENIAEELFEIKKDLLPALRKFVYDKPYEFLFVNVDTQTYFKSWDKINIT
jgi:hypothetical protein